MGLERFIKAQESTYASALEEVKNGKKVSHWMWFIFPQIQGLGLSETAKFYAIKDIHEAEAFLKHPVLGERLISICTELLNLKSNNALQIFGSPDNLKLKSSMTLFDALDMHAVFDSVLTKFFDGERDQRTLGILNISSR